MELSLIREQAESAIRALLEVAKPQKGELMVLGCSTSEVQGKRIGSSSSEDVAKAILDGVLPVVEEYGIFLAVQGCEHINRCLCVSHKCMEQYNLQHVWVKPWLHAGGACVTEALSRTDEGLMVEDLKAQATLAMDVGDTLIGMHLRAIAVPLHCAQRKVGDANLVLAYTRPKYVGGPRAQYETAQNPHSL